MFYTYILYSKSLDVFYKGQTKDLTARISRHNNGLEKSTKSGRPWILLWSTKKDSRSGSKSLETKLKNLSRQRTIEFMLKYHDDLNNLECLGLLYQLSNNMKS